MLTLRGAYDWFLTGINNNIQSLTSAKSPERNAIERHEGVCNMDLTLVRCLQLGCPDGRGLCPRS